MKKKFIAVITLIFLIAICWISSISLSSNKSGVVNTYGSAKDLAGTSIVVSIFADDKTTSWDDEKDAATIENIRSYLGIAEQYLEDTASAYNKSADFITDFKANPDLKYLMTFDDVITTQEYIDAGNADEPAWNFIDTNIDEDALKQKYDADNVIYMIFVNSDEDCTAISCTRNWYEGMPYDYEMVYLFNYDSGLVNGPAVYAHEILHTFGAPDLYATDEEYNISDDFLEYIAANYPNDIMLTCSDLESGDYLYDSINNEVTEITAYYVGLIDSSDIAKEWNLGESQH